MHGEQAAAQIRLAVLDDERLDGEGTGDAAIGERAHDRLRQAEFGKGLL